MSVVVKVYSTIGPSGPEEAFLARAIAQEPGRDGSIREGFSVVFHGSTEADARAKAEAWIVEERARQLKVTQNREAGGERLREMSAQRRKVA